MSLSRTISTFFCAARRQTGRLERVTTLKTATAFWLTKEVLTTLLKQKANISCFYSTVNFHAAPVSINDLSRLGLLCLRDAFLRRAAILVPAESSPERNELLKTIGMHLGRQLADMPVLWPQVATYGPGLPPDPARLSGRSGLILGSAFQWPLAFGKNLHLAIEGAESPSSSIMLRGEPIPVVDFDSSLSFVQLLPSPWSKGEIFATIGGVSGYGGKTTLDLLTDPSVSERLSGTVAAADASGRVITYDVRFIQEVSLSNHIRMGFASGTTPSRRRAR